MVRTERRRYLAFAAEGPAPGARALEGAVLDAARRAVPQAGSGRASLRVFHARPGAGILRLPPSGVGAARAALDGLRVEGSVVRTVRTSGTLRAARRALGVRATGRRRRGPRKPAKGASPAPP